MQPYFLASSTAAMAGRPATTMWEQLGSHYIQTDGPPGKWLKAKCRHCNWQQAVCKQLQNAQTLLRSACPSKPLAEQCQQSEQSERCKCILQPAHVPRQRGKAVYPADSAGMG